MGTTDAPKICRDLLGDIAGAAVNASQEMDRVCDNLDFITLTCPETEDPILQSSPMNVEDDEEDELLGPGSPALSVELEEREALTLLDSPTSSPLPSPAPQTSHPYACSDICDRMSAEELAAMKKKAKEEEEARLARKSAKKAIKKKSKEAKKQKKALQPVIFNWTKDAEAEDAAAMPTPLPSTSGTPLAPPTPAPWTLAPYTIPRRTQIIFNERQCCLPFSSFTS